MTAQEAFEEVERKVEVLRVQHDMHVNAIDDINREMNELYNNWAKTYGNEGVVKTVQ